MVFELIFVFCFTFAALFILRKVAYRIGLVDTPNLRKHHQGTVPLIGGVAIFSSISFFLFNHPDSLTHTPLLFLCLFTLIVIGVVDDKFDISFKLRLAVQALLTMAMMYLTDLKLDLIGNIFGTGDIYFGYGAYLMTILGVIAAINAFNMVDGIDGLLGGLSIVTFSGMTFLLYFNAQVALGELCLVLIVAMLPYVMMNMGAFGRKRKVFMGDAGSMMIGFLVIWILLSITQPNATPIMRPVTALWLIALPLMDMAAIMYRRIKRGRSPFYPDRDHLHHICLKAGMKKTHTLFTICGISGGFAIVGILGELLAIHESIMFAGFIATFMLYSYMLKKNWPKRVVEMIDEAMANMPGEYVPLKSRTEEATSSEADMREKQEL